MRRALIALMAAVVALSMAGPGLVGAQTADASNMEFQEQALGDDSSIVVENVTLEDGAGDLQNGSILVTYNNSDGNAVIAGLTNVTEPNGTDVPVGVDNTTGFPGDHQVHLLDTDTSGFAVNGTVDPSTGAVLMSSDAQTVYDAEITLDNEDIGEENIDEINLTSVDVDGGEGNGTDYGVVVHPHDDDGVNTSESLGETDVLNGSNEGVAITLDEDTETNTTYTAMVHLTGEDFDSDEDDLINESALLSYDSDDGGLTAVTSTADGGDNAGSGDGLFLGGNDLPVIGDLPLLGSLTPLALGLIILLIGGAIVGVAYYQAENDAEFL